MSVLLYHASLTSAILSLGNKGFLTDCGTPIIFDPAVYYGDREVDIAMSTLFGTFSSSFYSAYNEAWPLPPGYEQRRIIYNLYHILNHYILFGGSYLNEANAMIAAILRM